jgi:hypothetical protein
LSIWHKVSVKRRWNWAFQRYLEACCCHGGTPPFFDSRSAVRFLAVEHARNLQIIAFVAEEDAVVPGAQANHVRLDAL